MDYAEGIEKMVAEAKEREAARMEYDRFLDRFEKHFGKINEALYGAMEEFGNSGRYSVGTLFPLLDPLVEEINRMDSLIEPEKPKRKRRNEKERGAG